MKIEYDLKEEAEKTRKKRIEISNLPKNRINEKITKFYELLQEEEDVYKSVEKSEEENYIKFSNELKLLLINLSDALYNQKKYSDCIEIDRKILAIDEKYHQSYARLYYCYKKIGKNESAVIFGSMIKFRADKETIEKNYKELVEQIDKELVEFNEKYQNKNYWKESGLFSTTNIIQLIIFFCSLCYIIYQSFKNKKDNPNVNK
jgi:tetratricopeptide (TPR) repeat protein